MLALQRRPTRRLNFSRSIATGQEQASGFGQCRSQIQKPEFRIAAPDSHHRDTKTRRGMAHQPRIVQKPESRKQNSELRTRSIRPRIYGWTPIGAWKGRSLATKTGAAAPRVPRCQFAVSEEPETINEQRRTRYIHRLRRFIQIPDGVNRQVRQERQDGTRNGREPQCGADAGLGDQEPETKDHGPGLRTED